jgi:hypothetical protein
VSWNEHHSASEKLAVDAEMARRLGNTKLSEELYKKAASEEELALEALEDNRQRTRGITATSTVALWYKGRDYRVAERCAHRYLAAGNLPTFAEKQLRDLLSAIWTAIAAEEAGIRFVPGDVLVSVKGGEVIHGGAPLELIMRRVEGIQSVLFRTVEMLLERPFRRRGGPSNEVQTMFRPWLFQAPAGSYQFAVRMREPLQREFWEVHRPKLETVTTTFFRVLRATATGPDEELARIVPDQQYRGAFLNLARNLAPVGATFDRLEVRDAGAPSEPLVTLAAETRQELNATLRKMRPQALDASRDQPVVFQGVLRALDLDRDWLEVTVSDVLPGMGDHVRISQASDALDDVVGPMVNKRVTVTAVRDAGKYLYRDIELAEE